MVRIVRNDFEADGDLSRISGKASTPNAIERTYANAFSYTADGRIEKLKLGNNRWEWAKFNERIEAIKLTLEHWMETEVFGNWWTNTANLKVMSDKFRYQYVTKN